MHLLLLAGHHRFRRRNSAGLRSAWSPAPPYNGPPRPPTMAPRASLQWPPAPPYNGPPRPPTMNGLPRAAAGEEVAGGGWGEAADELYIYNILLVSTSPQWKIKGKLAGLCSPHVRPTFAPPLRPSGKIKGKLAGLCSPHGRSRFPPAATPSPGLRIFREVGLAWF